jgi:uroporphyrin-III C-methyltransferase/precorrin-2 dehydrogenase/sirohydrochlorin ferrochelatase
VDYFPCFLDLRQQRCLVVGGGEVARRKVALLLRAGAHVRVVASELGDWVQDFAPNPALQCEQRPYAPADLDDVVLVIAATNQRDVNAQVSAAARARRLPVNVVDDPVLCSFIVPAFVDRAPVLVAVGTGGSVPVLARLLRTQLEVLLPQRYGDLAQLCARLRPEVQRKLPDVTRRRRFWEVALEGAAAERAFSGDILAAEHALRAELDLVASSGEGLASPGQAFLIGAGPNDPELLSLRAQRLLQRAELVLVSDQVSERVAELSRRDAARGRFTDSLAAADGVIQQLVAATQRGQRVCVLAAGDAFRQPDGLGFAARARALGVECLIVPGIA